MKRLLLLLLCLVPSIAWAQVQNLQIGANPILGGTSGYALTVGSNGRLSQAAALPASTLAIGTPLTGGTSNCIVYDLSNAVGCITTAINGVLVTNGSGVPSISTTLPNGLAMGTPASLDLANATGLPATGFTIGSGATPTSGFTNGHVVGVSSGTTTDFGVSGTGTTVVLTASPVLTGTPVLADSSFTSMTFTGAGLIPVTPGSRAPLFVWNNPTSNSSGQNCGVQIWIGASLTGTPGANDCIAETIHIDDIGRGALWGRNIDAQQSLVGGTVNATTTGDTHSSTTIDGIASMTGIAIGQVVTCSVCQDHTTVTGTGVSSVTLSLATTGTVPAEALQFASPGIVRGDEIDVVANALIASTTNEAYPTGPAVWAYEAVGSQGSTVNPLTAFRVEGARDNTQEWFSYGLTMRRVLNAGIAFEDGAGDANHSFQTALIRQITGNTPAALKLDGTVTDAINTVNGTVTNIIHTPSFTLSDAGVYTGTFSVAGAVTASGVISTTTAGSAAAPEISLPNNTGLYGVSTTGIGISVNGTLVADWGISNANSFTVSGSQAAMFLGNAGVFMGGVSAISRNGATGAVTINSNADNINLTPGGGTVSITGALNAAGVTSTAPIVLPGYAVASLPASPGTGALAYVTDQLTACPALSGTFTGGGSVKCRAWYNGTAWVQD